MNLRNIFHVEENADAGMFANVRTLRGRGITIGSSKIKDLLMLLIQELPFPFIIAQSFFTNEG